MPASFSDFAPYDFNDATPFNNAESNALACPECQCQLTTQYTSTPLRYKVIYADDKHDYPATGYMMGCMKCRLQWYNLLMPSHDAKLETPDEGATYIVKAIGLPRYKWVKAWSRVDNPTTITFIDPRPVDDTRNTETSIVAYDDRNTQRPCLDPLVPGEANGFDDTRNTETSIVAYDDRNTQRPSIKRFFGFLGRMVASCFGGFFRGRNATHTPL